MQKKIAFGKQSKIFAIAKFLAILLNFPRLDCTYYGTCCNSQLMSNAQVSSIWLAGMTGFSARHLSSFPMSAALGWNLSVLLVTFPPSSCSVLWSSSCCSPGTPMSPPPPPPPPPMPPMPPMPPPSHHETRAAGLEPKATQWTS